ncbi:hypothetical protein CRM22_001003 [Opisthorchis felineus]|uniref:Uncharacterized protein n=1 Tax=Opisthorchis felineus TaxID=147828 RepID=A0A4S2MCL0_OPIFE|nr:hypothetical protein CRM22_001003 [Opisthorchis felineus]
MAAPEINCYSFPPCSRCRISRLRHLLLMSPFIFDESFAELLVLCCCAQRCLQDSGFLKMSYLYSPSQYGGLFKLGFRCLWISRRPAVEKQVSWKVFIQLDALFLL